MKKLEIEDIQKGVLFLFIYIHLQLHACTRAPLYSMVALFPINYHFPGAVYMYIIL
jgi:hypothetical protein